MQLERQLCALFYKNGINEMVHNSSMGVLYPANERKPDPLFIVNALENASDSQGLTIY